MERIIQFESPKDHYIADACVVWCFDDRFYKLLKAFGKQEGFRHIDLVKLAGGAKALANGTSSERDVLLNQIKLSIELHGAKRVVFMTHRDCGGYGGSKSFADADAERAAHESQLAAAKALVAGELPDISVDAYFADFDELYKI